MKTFIKYPFIKFRVVFRKQKQRVTECPEYISVDSWLTITFSDFYYFHLISHVGLKTHTY